jgi:LmbE family N-acetylglucosaminyl deacetylase
MKTFQLARPGESLSVLCLGAHSDDIEIGAGGTILGWIASGVRLNVHWSVFSAAGVRASEARGSALAFLADAASAKVELADFRDGFFPTKGEISKLGSKL